MKLCSPWSSVEAALGRSHTPALVPSGSHWGHCLLSAAGPSASPPESGDQTTLLERLISLEPPPRSLDLLSLRLLPAYPAQPVLTKGAFSGGCPPLPCPEKLPPWLSPGGRPVSHTVSAVARVALSSVYVKRTLTPPSPPDTG